MRRKLGRMQVLFSGTMLTAVIILAGFPDPTLAQPVRLSSSGLSTSDVETAKLSPDGKYVVYVHDDQIDDAYRLYSVPTGGGTPVPLSPIPAVLGNAPIFAISPDSTTVVYDGYFDSSTEKDLYSVSITGPFSSRVMLAQDVYRIQTRDVITPDSQKVVFCDDFNGDGDFQVVAVPIHGPASAAVALSAPPSAEATDVAGISPDGTRVVYVSTSSNPVGLLSVTIGSGPSTAIDVSPTVDYGSDIGPFYLDFTPDGQRIVYIWSGVSPSIREYLYSAPVAGPSGAAVQLDSDILRTSYEYSISPDSNTVVFSASASGSTRYIVQVPVAGPSSAAHLLNSGSNAAANPVICDDSVTVLYRDSSGDKLRLYRINLGASPSTRVEMSRDPGSGAGVTSFSVEPHGRRAVYVGDTIVAGWPNGFRVDVHGPPGADEAIWSRPVVEASGYARDFTITPSGAAVAMVGGTAFDSSPPFTERVWAVPLIGEPFLLAWELSPEAQSEDIKLIGISANNRWAVYIADANTAQKMELFAAEIPMVFADDFETGDTSVWSSSH